MILRITLAVEADTIKEARRKLQEEFDPILLAVPLRELKAGEFDRILYLLDARQWASVLESENT
jgi:hypothetical protein